MPLLSFAMNLLSSMTFVCSNEGGILPSIIGCMGENFQGFELRFESVLEASRMAFIKTVLLKHYVLLVL